MSSPSAYNTAQAVRRARALLYEQWQPRGEPLIVTRGPGRLNLIGEHTDYNRGYVMPVALDRAVVIAATPRQDGRVRAWSASLDSAGEYALGREQEQPSAGWVKYLQGVSWVLADLGKTLRGLDAVIFSDVPRGAGLSSSAALEVAWALALLTAAREPLPPRDLALACQRAENEYVGMRCGILDQFACVFGRDQSALLIDCDSLEMEVVPLGGHPVSLVVCDTNKPRSLVDSEYNRRRASCEEAARVLGVPSLRQANQQMVMAAREALGEENFKRAWHVVTENERVLETAAALKRGDLEAVGRMVSASHRSLRDYYEVSCSELEAMWTATQRAGCYGSRLVGGGFGGAVLALVAEEEVRQFIAKVSRAYQEATQRQPNIFAVQVAGGAEVVLP
jgi:galactokinase